MKKISITELLSSAKKLKEAGVSWHHHFFTPQCHLNKSDKFWVILENESSGESFYAEFDEKPMQELKKMEELFFS
ncbi:MAG TPA: hypothetical protein VJC39_00100 [Candidatus Nanoarchaeia archaeon]|nr:hypothetical protein [Candidatus Nanoarchaeia archaeon]